MFCSPRPPPPPPPLLSLSSGFQREDVPVVSINVLAAETLVEEEEEEEEEVVLGVDGAKADDANGSGSTRVTRRVVGWTVRLLVLCGNGEATVWHLSGGTKSGGGRGSARGGDGGYGYEHHFQDFDPNRRVIEEATRLARFSVPTQLLQHRPAAGVGSGAGGGGGDDAEAISNALKFRLDGWWVDACARRLGVWSGSEVAIFDLAQSATGMVMVQASFEEGSATSSVPGGSRGGAGAGFGGRDASSSGLSPPRQTGGRKRAGTDTTVKSLTHRLGVSSGYTHIVGVNNGTGGGHSFLPRTALLACGKGPFLDLLVVDGEGGGRAVRVVHSWDLRRARQALPDKLKIYEMVVHPHLRSVSDGRRTWRFWIVAFVVVVVVVVCRHHRWFSMSLSSA